MRWPALAAVCITLPALAASASATSGRVAHREVASGARAAIMPGEPKGDAARVLRSKAAAARVLRAWGVPPGKATAIDFRRKSLIVVLAEYQPHAGFRAHVSHVSVKGRQATVTAGVRDESGELSSSVLERPWVVVAVNRASVADVRGEARVRRR
jgi:hypothetical protein